MNEGMENLKQIAELEEKCMKYISYIKKLGYKFETQKEEI